MIRFAGRTNWHTLVARYEHVFGQPLVIDAGAGLSQSNDTFADRELFDSVWWPLLDLLAGQHHIRVDAGGDVTSNDRVVGSYLAIAGQGNRRVKLVDASHAAAYAVVTAIQQEGCAVVSVTAQDVDGSAAAVLAMLEG